MLKQLSVVFAASSLFSTAHAGSILLNTDANGVLTSMTLDTTYTLTSDTDYGTIQLRIFDVYPPSFNNYSDSDFGSGFTLSVSGGTTYDLSDVGIVSQQISPDGGNDNYDAVIYLTNDDLSLKSGQTITISGTATVTAYDTLPFVIPADGDYSTCLASDLHGAILCGNTTETLATSSVPEPSTWAGFAGIGALGLAFMRRRKA